MAKPKIMADLAQVKVKEEELRQNIEDRGYLNSFVSGADLDTFTQNGIYAYSQVSANRPSETYGYLFVSDWGEGFCRQFVQDNNNHCFTRVMGNNIWGNWQRLATTDQINVLDGKSFKQMELTKSLDDTVEVGIYKIPPNILGSPISSHLHSVMEVFQNPDVNAVTQRITNTNGGGLSVQQFIRVSYLDGNTGDRRWGAWEQIATTPKTLNVKSQDDWGNDFNNANINGMYHVTNCQSLNNRPPTVENVGNLIVMSGTEDNSLSKVQYFIPFNNRGFYIRTRGYALDEWQEWKEIATTTKTNISITPHTGYAITRQSSYTSNGEVTIQIQVEKADGGTFYVGNHSIAQFPLNIATTISISTTCLASNGGVVNGGSAIVEDWNKNLRINVEDAATKYIWLTGKARIA